MLYAWVTPRLLWVSCAFCLRRRPPQLHRAVLVQGARGHHPTQRVHIHRAHDVAVAVTTRRCSSGTRGSLSIACAGRLTPLHCLDLRPALQVPHMQTRVLPSSKHRAVMHPKGGETAKLLAPVPPVRPGTRVAHIVPQPQRVVQRAQQQVPAVGRELAVAFGARRVSKGPTSRRLHMQVAHPHAAHWRRVVLDQCLQTRPVKWVP
jgi:hypothetical protein